MAWQLTERQIGGITVLDLAGTITTDDDAGPKTPGFIEEFGGGAGSCIQSAALSITREIARFLVKLLTVGTFDVFTDSPWFFSVPPESTEFLEALWRRREPVPEAKVRAPRNGAPECLLTFPPRRNGTRQASRPVRE